MKDREKIAEIFNKMLDTMAQTGIYPTSTAFTELELYIKQQRFITAGWCYSYCCNLLDKGLDPRTEEVPKLIEALQNDIG